MHLAGKKKSFIFSGWYFSFLWEGYPKTWALISLLASTLENNNIKNQGKTIREHVYFINICTIIIHTQKRHVLKRNVTLDVKHQ